MIKTMQIVSRAAQFAVSGLILAAPTLADELPRSSLDMGHGDLASPTAASALTSRAGRRAREISSNDGNRRETADQSRSYAAQIKDAYASLEPGRNPALAAFAASLAALAKREPAR